MCAFDLLATVAGKIWLEKESSPTSSNTSNEKNRCAFVQKAGENEDKPVKIEPSFQESSDKRVLVSELVHQSGDQNFSCRESSLPQNDVHSGLASVVTTDCSEIFVAEKLVNGENNNEMGSFTSNVDLGFSGFRDSVNCKLDCENKLIIKDDLHKTGKVPIGIGADMCSLEDPVVCDGRPPALVSSDSSVKVPLCGDHIPCSSFPAIRDDVKIVSRDDDENSSGCTHPSTIGKSIRPVSRIADRRIRKILASKYWKVSSKLKEETLSNVGKLLYLNVVGFIFFFFSFSLDFWSSVITSTSMFCSFKLIFFLRLMSLDGDLKPIFRNRKGYYKRQRSQMNIPFKKRKIFQRSSVSNSDRWISYGGNSHSTEKGINGDDLGSCLKMHGGMF